MQCASAVPAADHSAVVATDNCGGTPVITHSDQTIAGACVNKYVIKRTYTATDACGNSSSQIQTITVNDTTAPVITSIPTNVTVQCASAVPAPNDAAVVASDNCGGALVVTHSDQITPGSCVNGYVIARTYTVTDSCGNSTNAVQTITVSDTTLPVISSIPTNVTVQCPSAVPAANDGAVVATDNCGGVPVITHSDQTIPGACANKFVVQRTYTATDACGNSSSRTQTITVNDTNAPVISSIPTNVTVQCAGDVPTPNDGAVVATDNCGGAPVITHSDQTIAGACVNKFTVKRTYTATDACGNSSSSIQTITINDTTAPVISSIPADVTVQCPSAVPAADHSAVVATDNCGGTPVITHSDQTIAGTCVNKYVIKRTYTATDACGNSSSQIQTITISDTTGPVISSIPADVTVQCASAVPAADHSAVVATDNCGGTPVITHSDQTIAGACVNKYVIKRTYTATDACGNSSSQIQTITVNDTTAPVITSIPTNVTVQCASAVPAPNDAAVVASDNCGGTPVITHSDQTIPGACANKFVVKRTYTATDSCGNSSSSTQTISVNDNIPPALSIPADLTLECPANTTTNSTGVATAQDSCGTAMVNYSDIVGNICGGAKVISRVWTATDQCGNATNRTQTITLRDTTRPTITVPPNLTLECGASTSPSATGTATGQDACSSVSITYSDSISNNCGGSRVINRTWTATDACGNSASGLQTIMVRDTTPPSLTLPANVVQQCPGDTRTNVTGVPTVSDVCSSFVVTYSDVVSNSCGATKTVWRTWTAVDACGNATNGLQTITVIDTTKPSISCPRISVQCVSDIPAPFANLSSFLAAGGTATDSCSSNLTFSQTSDSGLVGRCPGTVTRVYRVTDACGNYSECTQAITVDDTIAPVLTCPTNLIVECGAWLDPANIGSATARDNCSTNVTLAYSDTIVQGQYNLSFYVADPDTGTGPYAPTYLKFAPGSLPCPDSARLTGRALDPLRNAVAYATNGQLDALTSIGNVPMAFGQIVPYEVVIQASGGPGPERGTIEFTAAWSTYTTSNNRFGYDTNYMVYCAFVDAADPGSIDPNNNARVESYSSTVINPGTVTEAIQGTFRVSGLDAGDRVVVEIWVVLDSAMPEHTGGSVAATLVSAQTAANPPVPITVGVQTDSLGNLSKIFPLPAPQQQPPLGPLPVQPPVLPGSTINVISRRWTATDDCGNVSTCVQQITVRDTSPPALVAPPDMVLDCPATDTSTNVTGSAVAPDACGGSVKVYYSDTVTNGCGATKVIFRTWTATDESGNTINAVQTITVRDITKPNLTCPPDLVLDCPANTGTNNTGVATAQDSCSQVTIRYNDLVTNICSGSSITFRTWTATDACGNSSSCVQSITVRDISKPSLTCPPDLVLDCPADTSTNSSGVATAQDSCSLVTIRYSDLVTNICSGSSITFRTWTATDQCGNSASCVQKITVQDTTKPAITCPPDLVLDCPAATGTNTTGVATAQDSCSQVTIRYSDVVTNHCGGSTITFRTWTATDACGNSSSCVQTITVRDVSKPSLTCPSDLVLDCPADTSTNNTGVASAQDTCSQVTVRYSDIVSNLCGGSSITFRTWTATDACGNSNSCVQKITVRDISGPNLTCPPKLVLDCPADTSTNNTGVATAQDSCSQVTISYTDLVTNACGGSSITFRTWTATDACGNSSSCVQKITVRDITRPNLTCPPDLVLECPADTGTNNTGVASAQDTCSQVAVRYTDVVTNICGASSITFRTWTATDTCGNSNSCVQKITIRDTTPPTLSCQPGKTVSATNQWTFDEPTASDTCGVATVQVLSTMTNRPDTSTLTATRTWVASDACENTNTCQQTVTVLLGQLPLITSFPRSQIVAEGSDLTLTVTATSQTPCTYAWQLGGVPIPGASGTTCAFHGIRLTNAGVYSVIVSNAAGAVGSPAAVIDVGAKVSYQPISNRLALSWSSPYILQAAAAVTGPWTDVAGATSPYVPTAGVPRQFFRLRSPTIVFTTNYSGGQFTLSGPGVPGCNFIFQASTNLTDWVNLQTNPSPIMFIDSSASQYPNRAYRAVTAQPIVNPTPLVPPAITSAPLGQTAILGGGMLLTASAIGSGPLTYQWQLNGANIAAATGSSLSLNNLQFTNAGLYSVVVSNGGGITTSAAAVVNVGVNLAQQLWGSALQLTWPAPYVLQSALTAPGPYSDLAGVDSPYSYNLASGPRQFFRLRSPQYQFTSAHLPDGSFSMSGPGVPGYCFVFQATTDFVHWVNLQTNASPVSFVDSNAAQYPNRFYRAVVAH